MAIIDHFLFFSSEISNETLSLDTEQTRHAHTVLRIEQGDHIFVTDGKGAIYFCAVELIDTHTCTTHILERKIQEPPIPAMHFFIGLPEKDAFEAAIEGLVPLGVMHIIPMECQYCQKKWWTKQWERHVERFQKKIIAAVKQSWNAWMPVVLEPVSFAKALDMVSTHLVVADEQGVTLDQFSSRQHSDAVISCFVGPPGGFSPQERDALQRKNSYSVKLSGHRLRTELAATILAGNIVQTFMRGSP
jgi:16S rRNA (uracil1498-N3)-methyltransferase